MTIKLFFRWFGSLHHAIANTMKKSVLFIPKFKQLLIGHPLNPFHPQVLRHASLIAFLAWIGLGADSLSSACYGPEAAYLSLGKSTHLALYIAIATAITVFIISLSYNQVITLFPSGGGGYKVASQLLGRYAGLVSGSALIIDYILTIAVSTASGVDALFSLLPSSILHYKLITEIGFILALLVLNTRGVKESILLLTPVFLGFFITHVFLILYGITAHWSGLPLIIPQVIAETRQDMQTLGWVPVLALILHAYSLGSGTYTGLEAVSNNINRLREPRVATGKWTMLYIAISLSLTATGIILLYLLWNPVYTPGQTLNATVFSAILGHSILGHTIFTLTMLLEAGLLFVAANTGFLAGPSVLANMAIDHWMPKCFRQLSSRLVIQNGLILFGISALMILMWCRGKVALLVILYSINVFLTFSLSLLGLCRHWLNQRQIAQPWLWRFIFSLFACLITSGILCITLTTKFESGGWLTVSITLFVIGICVLINKHYQRIQKKLIQLDQLLTPPVTPTHRHHQLKVHYTEPTAAILVGEHQGIAMHALLKIQRIFPSHFKNFVFMRAGIVDVESFTGQAALQQMRATVSEHLSYLVRYCHQYIQVAAASYATYGTDTIDELTRLAEKVNKQYSNCVFFATKLTFTKENWATRLLHNETALTLQSHLHLTGKELVILPMKI